MVSRPLFQRSPRLHPQVPGGEVEIPAPPPAPAEPSTSLLAALWPIIPGLLSAVIMYSVARSNGTSAIYMLGYSLPVMAAGYLVQIGHYYFQKRKYLSDVERRKDRFGAILQAKRQELTRLRERQQQELRTADPDPAECLARVERRHARLWERSPHDTDFLSLRLGIGQAPFSVAIKTPADTAALEPDHLLQEAQGLGAEYGHVPGVPICLPLRKVGLAGLVGPRPNALAAARSLALQLCTHHSPDEVHLVAIFPAAEIDEWAWIRWLPHTWSGDRRVRYLAAEPEGARRLMADLYELLNRRKQALAQQRDGPVTGPGPHLVFLLADLKLTESEPIMALLFKDAASLGVSVLVLADRKEALPKECRAIVAVAEGKGQLVLTSAARTQADFFPDEPPVELAEGLARALAPLRPHQVAVPAEIPRRVTLLDLLGVDRVGELDVLSRWQEGQPYRSLAVPIGVGAGSKPLLLDLHERAHGPHGLAAGATGSGKSELLQTLVASLAVSFHPHEVAFVMVDYKGGGMANVFKGLPHLVGTITNLEGNLARRALAALKTELKRRQRFLGDAGVTHIDEYIRRRRQGAALEPLPHLIVIVDEFAELKAEQPEFMRELISAVRVGRSLGVHLLLATQKPAGVVDEQIWSNTRFRLCLRVERPEDSQEVIRCADAASITGAGRAYFQVGNNERFELFQAGWGGAPYTPGVENHRRGVEVREVALEGTRYELDESPGHLPNEVRTTESQLQALVDCLRAAAQEAAIEPLAGPWLPPLPADVLLESLRSAEEGWNVHGWAATDRWLEPVVGLGDDPEHQRQAPLRLPLGKEGHLAVYGGPGMGKTTFIQTLVFSLACDHSPEDLHLYLVDCSGRSLSLFTPLPHVGAVVPGDETERLDRLLRLLSRQLEERKEQLARVGVNTLAAYRRSGMGRLPAIVVVLDNYPALIEARPEVEDDLVQLSREGGNLGIHLVLTANSPAMIRHRVGSNLALAVSLPLVDRTEYSAAVGRTFGLEPMNLPGRGLVKANPPLEFQTALPVSGVTEWERTGALRALLQEMDRAWQGGRPAPVRVLPEVVWLGELIQPQPAEPPGAPDLTGVLHLTAAPDLPSVPVGLAVDSLEPFAVDLGEGPHLVITGPTASGKTTLLQTLLLALAERIPPEALELWLLDFGGGGLAPLKRLPHVQAYESSADGFEAIVERLAPSLQERRDRAEQARRTADPLLDVHAASHCPRLVVAIDDFDVFRDSVLDDPKQRLEAWIRRDRSIGLHVIAAGSPAAFEHYDGLCRALRELQTGFVLGSSDHQDLGVLGVRPPAGTAGRLLPPGHGYHARRGRHREVKAAVPCMEALSLVQWVQSINGRCKARA